MSPSSVVFNSSVQADSQDLDLADRVLPGFKQQSASDSEPKVASILAESESNISFASLLTPLSFTEVPGTPGILPISSVLPISHHITQLATTHANDEVPTRGTPSAIGALRLHRDSLILYATPLQNRKLNSNPPQMLCLDTIKGLEVDKFVEEREQEDVQLALAATCAQHNMCLLEHKLTSAWVKESEALGNLYQFRMQEAQCRLEDANIDVRLIRCDIFKNSVPLHNGHKRRQTSSSLHNSIIASHSASPDV
ncbi:hypothetical protein HD554DRAFT_2173338 [Boletus coccyginus]|nr:hypothetical protein HD554DRAFT_2173338 [Boletus coccyginus]